MTRTSSVCDVFTPSQLLRAHIDIYRELLALGLKLFALIFLRSLKIFNYNNQWWVLECFSLKASFKFKIKLLIYSMCTVCLLNSWGFPYTVSISSKSEDFVLRMNSVDLYLKTYKEHRVTDINSRWLNYQQRHNFVNWVLKFLKIIRKSYFPPRSVAKQKNRSIRVIVTVE